MTGTEDWKGLVREWWASGLTAEQFSKERGFPRARLWGWSSRLRKAEREATGGDGVRLVRVLRRKSAPEGAATVTVELQGARVVVQPGVDRATLVAVLEAVDGLKRAPGASR
jgi:transposase